jgi:hypothetical protein
MSAPLKDANVIAFKEIFDSYNAVNAELTNSEKARALGTIEALSAINQNLEKLSSIENDDLRNREINQLTNSGAEGGFSSNISILKERINVFTNTYYRAKSKNDLKGFLSCFMKGDPCLSGRMESLYKYAALLDGLDVHSMPDPEKNLFLPGTIFSNLIMNNYANTPEAGELKDYISKNISQVAKDFERYAKGDLVDSFFEFLRIGGIYEKNGKEIDWEKLLSNLVESKYFITVYNQSLKYVIL